jgi:molybdenum cofactor synthesis domain-containing protein
LFFMEKKLKNHFLVMPPLRLAILATGSELVFGEVLNTAGQVIASKLTDSGMRVFEHRMVLDARECIAAAIEDLLCGVDGLIITGGLGPTSDDHTRFAVSAALQLPLQWNEHAWSVIVDRFKAFGLPMHESNRQQALFPEGSQIFPNRHGTAAGFMVPLGEKHLFVLPGPPHESLPMLNECVLPLLLEKGYATDSLIHHWQLLGVVEGDVAAEVDRVALAPDLETGYRWCYPYLYVKVRFPATWSKQESQALISVIGKGFGDSLIAAGQPPLEPVSVRLRRYLSEKKIPIAVDDQVTGGLLSSLILAPENKAFVAFTSSVMPGLRVVLRGLEHYWAGSGFRGKDSVRVWMNLDNTREKQVTASMSLRGDEVRLFASEFAAFQIFQCLQSWFSSDH